MKKLIAVAIAAFIFSCGENTSTKTDSTSDSSGVGNSPTTDTSLNSMSKDTSMNSMSSSSTESASVSGGSMTMKDGKMMMRKNGKWVLMDQQVTCTDGCKVKPNGELIMKDGKRMMMKEGMMITKDGHMTDDKGKMMDNMMMEDDKKMSGDKKMKDSGKK